MAWPTEFLAFLEGAAAPYGTPGYAAAAVLVTLMATVLLALVFAAIAWAVGRLRHRVGRRAPQPDGAIGGRTDYEVPGGFVADFRDGARPRRAAAGGREEARQLWNG